MNNPHKDAELPAYQESSFDFRKDELFSIKHKQSKKCRICRIEKPFSEFYVFKGKNRWGELLEKLSRNCKECDKEIFRGNYKEHPQVRRAAKKNREKHRSKKRSWSKKNRNKPINKLKALMESWVGRYRYPYAVMLFGYTAEGLKEHLESQFEWGMHWNNWGHPGRGEPQSKPIHQLKRKWQVDHIKPVCSFDLMNEQDLKMCHSLSNLRPLWAEINMNSIDISDRAGRNLL